MLRGTGRATAFMTATALLLVLFWPSIPSKGIEDAQMDYPRLHVPSPTGPSSSHAFYSPSMISDPPLGEWGMVVIFVKFADVENSTSVEAIVERGIKPLIEYYGEVSYGMLTVTSFHLDEWLRLPHTKAYYGGNRGEIDTNWLQFITDSIDATDSFVDYTRYQSVMIVHVGDGEEVSYNADDIWSSGTLGKRSFPTADGRVSLGIAVVAETSPLGTFVHELGHNLGLPDLYSTSRTKEFVGPWSLMATGSWLGRPPGAVPSHLMAPEKMWLGWVTPSQIIGLGLGQIMNISIHHLETSGDVLAVKVPIDKTYYVVEYRRKILFDRLLPSEGVIISRVDESLSEGIIKVDDGDRGLFKAAWSQGMISIDRANEVAIKVWSTNSSHALLRAQRGFADLRIDGIEAVGSFVKDQPILFRVEISNIGVTPSNYQEVALRIDGLEQERKGVSAIDPNSNITLDFSWRAVPGEHTVAIVADVDDTVVERSEENNAQAITLDVREKLTVIIDSSYITTKRADVGSTQKIAFHAVWEEGPSVQNGLVFVNGTAYTTNSTGWVTFEVSSQRVGKEVWTVTGVYAEGVTSYHQKVPDPYIIWDRVKVSLTVPDERIDVGSNATVRYKAIYEYDSQPLSGIVSLNDDTFTQTGVGKRTYRAVAIKDDAYGLAIFTTNEVTIVFDRVRVVLQVEKNRVDVGAKATLTHEAWYEFDGREFSGTIVLNDTVFHQSEVGRKTYRVLRVVDEKYGIEAFITNEVSVIFDEVEVVLRTLQPRVELGNDAMLVWTAQYRFDKTHFVGQIFLNDSTSKNSLGASHYAVSHIVDELYSLKTFKSNVVQVIFDRIIVDYDLDTLVPGRVGVSVSLTFESDGRAVDGATVVVNGRSAREVQTGVFAVDVTNLNPYASVNMLVKRPNFTPSRLQLSDLDIGN